jgi:hypothetical protein
MLDSFFPLHCPTATNNLLPFNKSQIFTLSLQLSTVAFTLLSGHQVGALRGGIFSPKERQEDP